MGRLIEQPIKALFNGVSRQPHNVRLTSQVEEANNTLLSVVTGGFEKRPATQRVLSVTGLAATGSYAFHTIDRDPTEQYVVIVDNAGVIKLQWGGGQDHSNVEKPTADIIKLVKGDSDASK